MRMMISLAMSLQGKIRIRFGNKPRQEYSQPYRNLGLKQSTIRIRFGSKTMIGQTKPYRNLGLKDSHLSLLCVRMRIWILLNAGFVKKCQLKILQLITSVLLNKMKKLSFLVRFVMKFIMDMRISCSIQILIKMMQTVRDHRISHKDLNFPIRDRLPQFLIIQGFHKHIRKD